MRRLLLVLALLASAVVAQGAEDCSVTESCPQCKLPTCLVFDGATADGDSAVIYTYGFRNLSLEVWSAAGSIATISILCKGHPDAPWKECAVDMTNPTADTDGTFYVSLARSYMYKINISGYAAGDIYASFERYSN